MNYLRQFRNRFITKFEMVSALDEGTVLLSPSGVRATAPEFNTVYFTLPGSSLTQESKQTSSGPVYTASLKLSFPAFPGIAEFMQRFSKIAELRLTTNTGTVISLDRNDVAMNKPIDGNFKTSITGVEFEASISMINPFDIDE